MRWPINSVGRFPWQFIVRVLLIPALAGATSQAVTAGTLRLHRISIEDRQIIGGEAASFLAPVDWKVDGGVVWRAHPALPASSHVRVFDPRSLTQVEVFPSAPFTWGNICGPGKLMPIGVSWYGNEVHPPIASAASCLSDVLLPRLRRNVRYRVTQHENLPKPAEAQRENSPQAEASVRLDYDAARVRIEYSLNNQPVEEEFSCVMSTLHLPTGGIVIQVSERIVAMRAARGELDGQRQLLLTIVNSAKVNPKWFNKYAQLVEAIVRAKLQEIRAVGEFSRMLARTSDEISQQRMQQWEQTQASQDRIDREWSEHIRGVETYNDPVEGRPVELPSGYNHAWVSRNGEYMLSDNPNFNPNVEANGTWEEMKPAP